MTGTEVRRARSEESPTAEWKRELYDAKPEREGELSSRISGLDVEPLYTRDNVEVDYERDLGYPGVYPFTRGVYPSMYRGKLWTMRQFAGFGTAAETNERFRYLLEHGQTGLSTAFDMPTLMGYDSDHPRSLGEVGREGVAVDSLEDVETLFAGIPLGEVSTSMTINSPAAILLAFYLCVGEEQGVERAALRGTVDRKSTRLNSSHSQISYAVFCLKEKVILHRAGAGVGKLCPGAGGPFAGVVSARPPAGLHGAAGRPGQVRAHNATPPQDGVVVTSAQFEAVLALCATVAVEVVAEAVVASVVVMAGAVVASAVLATVDVALLGGGEAVSLVTFFFFNDALTPGIPLLSLTGAFRH